MKRTLVYGAATAVVLATLGTGAGLTRCSQSVEAIYGPPPIEDPSDNPATGQTGNQQSVTVVAQDDPDEPIEAYYGPPFTGEPEIPIEDVYGPPPVSDDGSDDPTQEFYGPPVVYEQDAE
ncbi:MAG: hypothetical protein IKE22_02870 [Atopobiaceae bacterium]|nr:hypothetical protein [Atopobiaceae bacterium]